MPSSEQTNEVKIGVQTMMWGKRLTPQSLVEMFENISNIAKANGQKEIGVEFAQNPCHLGFDTYTEAALALDKLLAQYHLTLLGFSGRGSLKSRVKFCEYLSEEHKPQYFHVQRWFENFLEKKSWGDKEDRRIIDLVTDMGSCIAFHPFRYCGHDKHNEIIKYLEKYNEILSNQEGFKFILDTAHLWLAGNNLIGLLNDTKLRERLVAIHFKDWKKTHDSSLRLFSRGFTELGHGSISTDFKSEPPPENNLNFFVEHAKSTFGGWCVIEQDYTAHQAKDSLNASLKWFLSPRNKPEVLDINESRREFVPHQHFLECIGELTKLEKDNELEKRNFVLSLHTSTIYSIAEFADLLERCCQSFFNANECILWEVAPRLGCMQRVLRFKESQPTIRWHKIDRDDCNSLRMWILNERQLPKRTNDVHKKNPNEYPKYLDHYDDHFLLKKINEGSDYVLSFPICNSYCYSQIEARVDLFLSSGDCEYLMESMEIANKRAPEITNKDCTISENDVLERQLELTLDDMIVQIAVSLERLWGTIARQEANDLVSKINPILMLTLSKNKTEVPSVTLLKTLANHIQEELECTTCNYHEVPKNISDIKYQQKVESANHTWTGNDICSLAWKHDDFYCDNKTDDSNAGETSFAFPIHDPRIEFENQSPEKSISHVFHCKIKSSLLTASSENIISEMLHDFNPLLSSFSAIERRSRTLAFISHELLNSLINITEGVGEIQTIFRKKSIEITKDYFSEVFDYCDLASLTIKSADFMRYGKDIKMDRTKRVELLREIIWPVIHRAKTRFDHRNQMDASVFYQGKLIPRGLSVDELPPILNIDKLRFMQVFFNLISNSIKYSFKREPAQIEIQIETKTKTRGIVVVFRDWGLGVMEQHCRFIFDEHYRCPEIVNKVTGDGLGLWIASEIISAHNGTIELTNPSQPTEFTISIPNCW